jgi:hypothetical protein
MSLEKQIYKLIQIYCVFININFGITKTQFYNLR